MPGNGHRHARSPLRRVAGWGGVVLLMSGAGCGRLGYEDTARGGLTADGGLPDAGDVAAGREAGEAPDTGPGDAPPPAPDPDLLMQRDFEDDQALWYRTWSEHGGMIAQVTDRVHAGRAAMRVQTRGLGGMAAIDHDLATPLTDGELYLRSWFLLPAGQRYDHWLVLMEGAASRVTRKASFDVYPAPVFGLFVSSDAPTEAGALVEGRWFCALLYLRLHPTAGTARLSIDGEVRLERTGIDTVLGMGIDIVRVGLMTGPMQGDTTLYVDDFTASRAPLACP